ncbi:MAG: GGDEF domain-containing protein [Xanthomonadales bacterium]|nr:GGDEF domain-containing protein [Xanthomonadales bacterium]MCB1633695.1 GGDEF domain-containing protein [Xanthomonadales bacterium]
MSEVSLLQALIQGLLLFSLILAAFRARTVFGHGLLFLLLGGIEGLKYFLAGDVAMQIGGVPVALSSALYYPATLAAFLLVYLREDAVAARQLVWSLMFANVGLGLLIGLTALQQQADAASAAPAILGVLWRVLVGTALLFVGAIGTLLLYHRLQRWHWPWLAAALLSLSLMLLLDTLIYDGLTQHLGQVDWRQSWWTALAKALLLSEYLLLMWAYLHWVEASAAGRLEQARSDEEVWVLSYRERFARLQREVITDALTGSYNRRHLDHWLPDELRTLQLRGQPLALLLLDIDHFKQINDRFGHLHGDEALRHFARVVSSTLRRGDLLFRYGGEEFVLVLPGADLTAALVHADQIRQQLRSLPTMLGGQVITLVCTMGAAALPEDGHSAAALLATADRRLYRGKREGRDRCIAAD